MYYENTTMREMQDDQAVEYYIFPKRNVSISYILRFDIAPLSFVATL